MIILVTGVTGLVGSAFARAAERRGHRVVGVVRTPTPALPGVADVLTFDVTDERATMDRVLDVFPDAIVNCAAVSVPEQCDAQPALAQALNVALPTLLARLAHHVSARFVHLSSEQVFDGSAGRPYTTDDAVSPINLYGRQKVESERAIHAVARNVAVTLRAPLLMGNSPGGQRSNHERLFADWAAGRTPRLFVDEFRQPCTAENLAEVMVESCERRDLDGVYHWAGAEVISRFELGQRVRAHFRLSAAQAPIQAVTRADVPELAGKRQPSLPLDVTVLSAIVKTRPQPVAAQLEELVVPPPFREWYRRQG